MDGKIVFIHFWTVLVIPIVMGCSDESYFFLGAKMTVFVLHRSDIDEVPSSSGLLTFVREAGPLGYSLVFQYPFPDIAAGIKAFV